MSFKLVVLYDAFSLILFMNLFSSVSYGCINVHNIHIYINTCMINIIYFCTNKNILQMEMAVTIIVFPLDEHGSYQRLALLLLKKFKEISFVYYFINILLWYVNKYVVSTIVIIRQLRACPIIIKNLKFIFWTDQL